MKPLDLVTFDAQDYEPRSDDGAVRVWSTPAGDGLGLFHFAMPPDLEGLHDIDRLRAFYRRAAGGAGLGIVEVERRTLDGCAVVRTIMKAPQEPRGRTYLASLTFPFRDFSYVWKVQCAERGITGMRDTVVFGALLANGTVTQDAANGVVGWLADPYDPTFAGPMCRNRSEAVEHDARFPEHPLSRARAVLGHLEQTVRVAPNVRGAAPFAR